MSESHSSEIRTCGGDSRHWSLPEFSSIQAVLRTTGTVLVLWPRGLGVPVWGPAWSALSLPHPQVELDATHCFTGLWMIQPCYQGRDQVGGSEASGAQVLRAFLASPSSWAWDRLLLTETCVWLPWIWNHWRIFSSPSKPPCHCPLLGILFSEYHFKEIRVVFLNCLQSQHQAIIKLFSSL